MSPPARKPTATSRLMKDYARLREDPVPLIVAEPNPKNVLEWHYVVSGPENSPYFGGQYHGNLVFPPDYPFKPPSVYMMTPNGRFKTNKRLCLSISDFHPDTWNPAWSVSTILVGLLSFMLEDTITMGSIETSLREKRICALDSALYNLKNDTFREIFPSLSREMFDKLTVAQRRRLKEDFVKRKVKWATEFPELKEIPLTSEGGGGVTAETTNGDCDRNNNKNKQNGTATNGEAGRVNEEERAAAGNDGARNGAVAGGEGQWSMNVVILGVILAGLVVNYVLKVNNFYD